MDGLKIVVQKMGPADIEELLKAAALLAEQDCIALLGSETGKLVAAVGGLSWLRAEGLMWRSWTRPCRQEEKR